MISVIIPTFNRAISIKKAIDSIFSQMYQDLELIVVDDGSRDETPRLISDYGARVIYLRQVNKGPAAARNLGIKRSSGAFIAFLDSDDWWDKEMPLSGNSRKNAAYTETAVSNEEGCQRPDTILTYLINIRVLR